VRYSDVLHTIDRSDIEEDLVGWGTGDWHGGSRFHDEVTFEKHWAWAVDAKAVLFHVGDALEMTTITSKVASKGALLDQVWTTEQQREWAIMRLSHMDDGVFLAGNHEQRIDNTTGLNFAKSLAENTKVKPLDVPGFVRVLVGDQQYNVLMHHGEGPAANPATLANRLQSIYEGADLVLAGHIHSADSNPVEMRTVDGPRHVQRLRVGHYLDFPPYVMRRPTTTLSPVGSWRLRFRHDIHRIETEWMYKDY